MKPECKYISRPDEFNFESNDCTVRAITVAFKMPYCDTHRMLAKWGRVQRRGIYLSQFMKQTPVINEQKHIHKTCFMTILSFVKKFPKGTYLCRKSRHAFAIIDGIVYGETKLRSIITDYWIVGEEVDQPTIIQLKTGKKTQKQIILDLYAQGNSYAYIVEKSGLKKANIDWYFSKLKLKK